MQALGLKHIHIRDPRENPTNQLLATRCHHAQFDVPVSVSSDLLGGLPLPLGDIDCHLGFKKQPDPERLFASSDSESPSGVFFRIE